MALVACSSSDSVSSHKDGAGSIVRCALSVFKTEQVVVVEKREKPKPKPEPEETQVYEAKNSNEIQHQPKAPRRTLSYPAKTSEPLRVRSNTNALNISTSPKDPKMPKFTAIPSMILSSENNVEPEKLRIQIVGPAGVGKTSLALRFTKNVFVEDLRSTYSENTLYYKHIKVDGEAYELEIIDTGYKNSVEDLDPEVLKSADGIIMVYSIASIASFEELGAFRKYITNVRSIASDDHKKSKRSHFKKWRSEASNSTQSSSEGEKVSLIRSQSHPSFSSIRSTGLLSSTSAEKLPKEATGKFDNVPIFLVGTQSDSVDNRQVPVFAAKELAVKLNLPFFETSSKNFTGINECFSQMVQAILAQRKRKMKKEKEHCIIC